LCGAITGMRGAYASLTDLANQVNRDQSSLSKLYKRVTKKAEELSVQLWDKILYKNNLGRSQSKLLTQEQKDAIIALVTSSRDNQEKEAWQAIHNSNFNKIVPKISITTFKNVMYKARYARRRPE
jgi:hypothetical protein